ncbi:YcxB family protein [Gelatiniphilus marinus]|uniref:YcxB family protein n=1 Tax=Gelatiniphilus marinus TaxID=1759464 RepID=A0ABW5JP81_9FLAO
MIQTKQYSISKKEYTKIILLKRLKKSWWLYLSMLVLGLFHFQQFGEDSFSTFFSIFAFAYPLITFTYLYFWTNSKGHKPIFSKTDLSFDNDYLYFKRNDNETKLNPNSIQKVISNPDYWMLYISKGQFIYVPKHIFYTENDFDTFSNLINDNQ